MTFTSRTSIPTIAATLIAAVALSVSVHAQTLNSRVGVVAVPFAFDSGSTHLPAGTYTISLIGQQVMTVSGASKDAANSMVRRDADKETSAATKVVFHRYGNQYFLREVWNEGAPNHLVAIETKAEATARKAPKTLAIAGVTAPSVEQVSINSAR